MDWLNVLASVATILPAFVVVIGYRLYIFERRRNELDLVAYPKGLNGAVKTDKRQCFVLHLPARLGLTEDKNAQIIFYDAHINRVMRTA
jgi:hypothetical protein